MAGFTLTNCFTLVCLITINTLMVSGNVIDLTHRLNSRSEHYQLFKDFELKNVFKSFRKNLGMWVEANDVSFNEHTGTHVDAPVHTWETGTYIHQVNMEDLIGPYVVISVVDQAKSNRDYALTKQDVLDFERKHGQIPNGAIVLLNTGGAKDYWSKTVYLGTETPTDASSVHYPGFGGPVLKWLISDRGIKGAGVDRVSFDCGQNTGFPAHTTLSSNGKFGIENLNNLDKLPPIGGTLVVGVLPIEDGSGAPARVVALFNMTPGDSGAARGQLTFGCVVAGLFLAIAMVI